jgi:tetratricopeptide (TPR) repeat protein
VNFSLLGLLGGLALAASPVMADTNIVVQTKGVAATAPNPNDPVEKEFQQLMANDDAAQAEVDQWVRENAEFAAKGAGVPPFQLKRRIQERFEPVRKAYEDFLQRHPGHSRARVAYASFLGDLQGEEAAQEQLEKALALDTNNPAIYNNLAEIYAHHGPVKKAFDFYEKAIQLNPREPLYYDNFGTVVFLFRAEAKEYYDISQDQVFAKTFQLYSNATRLAPDDFPLASRVAQTYYGIEPLRTDEALRAWTNALAIAHDEVEREGVYIHFARLNLLAGRLAIARAHLNAVTNTMYADMKNRVTRNLEEREKPAQGTNAPPPIVEKKP